MKSLLFVFLLIFAIICAISAQAAKFYVTRQWKYLNFTWPTEEILKSAEAQGLYIPENNVIAGVKYFEDYFYVTLPRMKRGVPATLARIKAGPAGHEPSPNLEPYPSWEMNSIDSCNGLQNVQNVEIDTKGRIWIIDGGRTDTLDEAIATPHPKCAPKLLIFDIKRNETSVVYNFPEEVAMKNSTYLYDIVVDNTDGWYAYITDNSAVDPGIIVYSVKENRSWKIRHSPSMVADPAASTFTVNNITITAPINVAGIALGPKVHASNARIVLNEAREVYFSPLSSLHLFSVNTTILRNENLTLQSHDYTGSIRDIGVKPAQVAAMLMDNQGILYYSLLSENAIGRWDSHTPFQSEQKVIARDPRFVEWASSFALDPMGNLTVVVNRLNRFVTDKIDLNAYNFWLISAKVGGKSYLFDDNFNYDAVSVPTEEPQPTSSTTRRVVSTVSTTASTPQLVTTKHAMPSTGSNLIVGLVPVVIGSILFLM